MAQDHLDVEQIFAQAVSDHEAGRLEPAAAGYEAVLARLPEHAGALHLAGVAAHQQGDHARAEALIGEALLYQPGSARAHNNLGTVLMAHASCEVLH